MSFYQNTIKIKKLLIKKLKKNSGKSKGKIVCQYKKNLKKKKFFLIDFKRNFFLETPAIVRRILKDPNRSCLLALICYQNGIISYILAPNNLKPNNKTINSKNIKNMSLGNSLPLYLIPTSQPIFNIQIKKNFGGQIMRSAGTFGLIIRFLFKENKCLIKLKSGKIIKINTNLTATIGQASNQHNIRKKFLKAGSLKKRGKKPSTRGVAKNPVDHPHGGGEGKSSGGRNSVTPWGYLTKAKKFILKKK